LSFEGMVVLAEVKWDFSQIFQQKIAQLGYQRAKELFSGNFYFHLKLSEMVI